MVDAKCEIKKMWRMFALGSNSILELRALSPLGITPKLKPITKHFRVADCKSMDYCRLAFEEEALRLNALGYNIYIVMNPIKADFDGHAACDADIEYRDLLLIDIDRAVKVVEPADDAEIEAARLVANDVIGYLAKHDFSDPIRVMSGNGHHLYYLLKGVPNTREAEATVETILHNLARKFDNSQVKVDTVVFNASRITKVPGTIMRKGVESDGRHYRMAVIYEK